MERGWVKIHRSLIEDSKLTRSSRLALWIYILLSVKHTETTMFFCGEKITLKPGQGVFSTPDLARKLGESVSVIRRSLEWFESEQQIEQRKTTQGTVITVLNWHKYQNSEQPSEQRVNNDRTTSEQRVNNLPIIKECKECKNERSSINNSKELFVTQESNESEKPEKYQSIVDAWNALPVTNINGIKGSKRIEMLRARIKEYSLEDVLKAIENIKASPFLLGQNKRNWHITFDWFIRPNNFPKVLEGNYLEAGHNGVDSRNNAEDTTSQLSDWERQHTF